jgi:hypothetical protein
MGCSSGIRRGILTGCFKFRLKNRIRTERTKQRYAARKPVPYLLSGKEFPTVI